jgi:hypothetical protein
MYTTRTSDSYIATFMDRDDPQIADLRSFVSKCNRMLKEDGKYQRYYIKLQARGHRRGVRRYNQSLPLKYADRVDAYIYERRD